MRLFAKTTLPLDLIRSKLTEEEALAVSTLRPEELSQCLEVTGINIERISSDIAMTTSLSINFDKERAILLASNRITDFKIAKELEKISVPGTYSEPEEKRQYLTACRMLLEFIYNEYGNTPSYDLLTNPYRIGVAFTTLGEKEEWRIEVFADLINKTITKEIDGLEYQKETYSSLKEFIDNELQYLNFDELTRVDLEDDEISDWIDRQGVEIE